MIKTKLVHIDNWYPDNNTIEIGDETYIIGDEVNYVLWNIYENNGFPDHNTIKAQGMPRGPFEIDITYITIKGSRVVDNVVTRIEYKGIEKLHKGKQRHVRYLIKRDKRKAKAWNKYQKELRKAEKAKEAVVGHIKKQGVKNTVINWEKMLQLGK